MNNFLGGFISELTKLGSGSVLVKQGYGGGGDASDVHTVDIPHGMMDNGHMTPADRISPADAQTRLPLTGHLGSTVPTGMQGKITESKNPIDQFKYNRAYRDRR